ncbi:glycosyl hydrolase family 61-domain-containing protein, partial [Ephemerocybe angulata]
IALSLGVTIALLSHASAHWIFADLLTGSPDAAVANRDAVRYILDYTPVLDVTSSDITCNRLPRGFSNTTVAIEAGANVGFRSVFSDRDKPEPIWHPGPLSFYLGRVPPGQTAKTWDGKGENWFKISEQTATSNFGSFAGWPASHKSDLFATIPRSTPSGEYLLRIEHIAIHNPSAPQFYVSCAQIEVTNGGAGNPSPLVSIPGYIKPNDPAFDIDFLHDTSVTSWKVPGASSIWQG